MSGRSVYAMRAGDQLKVGVTKDVGKRLRNLQTGTGHQLQLVDQWVEPDAAWVESTMHAALRPFRLMGEWFACSDELARMAHQYAKLAALNPDECCVPWHDCQPLSIQFSEWIDANDGPERELKMILHVLDGHFPCLRTLSMQGGARGRLTSSELDALWAWWAPIRDGWAESVGLPARYSGPARTWIYSFCLDAEDEDPEESGDRLTCAINWYERVTECQ